MANIKIRPVNKIEGMIEVPGDKSISHRAVMLSSIAEGRTEIRNLLMGEDCIYTINAFREMGVIIDQRPKTPPAHVGSHRRAGKDQRQGIIVKGKGLRGLKRPKNELYLGNSGTTIRLLMGILAGQEFDCVLRGDDSLSKRPMDRVAKPLRMMGAEIGPRTEDQRPKTQEIYPPLTIKGKYPLKAIRYKLPIASAQVKSAVLLAGLYAEGITEVEEPLKSRDHTERMLKGLGANIITKGLKISIEKSILKSKGEIFVPGDISSAVFFMVAALILRSSKITVKGLGLNPTRLGAIEILRDMGAKIEIANFKNGESEPSADAIVYSSDLKGVNIEGEVIPRAIDELPIIMVAAAFARGRTVIKGAGELRVKEADRIVSMATGLTRMGADITTDGDDITINGTDMLKAAEVDSFGDHRTAMSMVVAGLRAKGETVVLNTDCINTSFPDFEALLGKLV
jgi:3-phosphoshikimate 1-carboxyvinyltransferase